MNHTIAHAMCASLDLGDKVTPSDDNAKSSRTAKLNHFGGLHASLQGDGRGAPSPRSQPLTPVPARAAGGSLSTLEATTRVCRGLIAAPLLIVLALFILPAGAQAEGCPNEAIRKREAEYDSYATQLPDCRAYEQVSPVDKNTTDADGKANEVQASPSGESISYYSIVPFPNLAAGSEDPTYLATRSGGGWSTQGLLAPTFSGGASNVIGLTADDAYTIDDVPRNSGPLLAPGAEAERDNFYIHNNATGEYWLLSSRATLEFADASADDSHILFTETREELVPGVVDPSEVPYLYEWDKETGAVTFVGVVDGKAPEHGTIAGSSEREFYNNYDQNTISESGSRIFFSEAGEGEKVYMREPEANRTVEISPGAAQWRGATPDGSMVFYTEAGGLYRFNVDSFEESKKPEPEALAEAREAIAGPGAEVLGLVGISSNGSYAYFAAKGVLPGENEGAATSGEGNLYEWHPGQGPTGIRFITTLIDQPSQGTPEDTQDWSGAREYEGTEKSSRVTPNGLTVLFSSHARMTSYDNAKQNELYLYDADNPVSAANPVCVSCNRRVAAATSGAQVQGDSGEDAPTSLNAHLPRNLSADGSRVFFQTEEALLPQDANGKADVYEWEQEGTGSCAAGEGSESGGCLYLISTGQNSRQSYFGDASENGEDVFFFTRQSLVSQDQDANVDLYDARVRGGLESQNPTASTPCEGEACRGSGSAAPALAALASVLSSGPGNLPPPPAPAAGTPKPKPPTRAEKLAKALQACRRQPKSRRARCRARAERRYGAKAKKSQKGGK
jgi:hypothetical protein